MSNPDNTREGQEIKKLFLANIRDFPGVIGSMMAALEIPCTARLVDVSLCCEQRSKTDVVIGFETPKGELRVDIHSFASSGYNQLDRHSVKRFCEMTGASPEDRAFLEALVRRKAANPNGLLVPPESREQAREMFQRIDVVGPTLLGDDRPNILALYSRAEKEFRIYGMDRQVLPHMQDAPISFSSPGGNIEIGNYLVVQRKGSDGKGQTDRANDIQVKMRTGHFYRDIVPLVKWSPAQTLP